MATSIIDSPGVVTPGKILNAAKLLEELAAQLGFSPLDEKIREKNRSAIPLPTGKSPKKPTTPPPPLPPPPPLVPVVAGVDPFPSTEPDTTPAPLPVPSISLPPPAPPQLPPVVTAATTTEVVVPVKLEDAKKVLIRTLLNNSPKVLERLPKGNRWKPVRRAAYGLRESPDVLLQPIADEAVDKFHAHIPNNLDITDIEDIIKISDNKYDYTSAADMIHVLEGLGFFDHKDFTKAMPIDSLLATNKIRAVEFTRTTFNYICVAVAGGIFPFQKDLNVFKNEENLAKAISDVIISILSEGITNGQLNMAMERAETRTRKRQFESEPQTEDKRKEVEIFFHDMRLNQEVGDPKNDGFYFRDMKGKLTSQFSAERCPLFTKYGNPKSLGAGGYGFVLKYSKLSDVNKHFAVKIQKIDGHRIRDPTIAPYRELRIMVEIMKRTMHWSPARQLLPFNHVFIYDWVRCELNIKERFAALAAANDETIEEQIKLFGDKKHVFQIIVEEFVSGGSTHNVLKNKKNPLILETQFLKPGSGVRGMASFTIQVLGHLEMLGRLAKITHHDVKPDNVLIQVYDPAGASNPIKYLVYNGTPRGTLYLPLSDSDGRIYKLADYGRASAYVQEKAGNVDTTVKIGHRGSAYNPAHDIENFFLMFLWSALNSSVIVSGVIDPMIAELLLLSLHPGRERINLAAKSRSDAEKVFPDYMDAYPDNFKTIRQSESDYAVLTKTFTEWMKGKRVAVIPEEWKIISKNLNHIILRIYKETLLIWENDPTAADLNMWNTLFAHRIFTPYTKKPADFTSANSVDMTDYRNLDGTPLNPAVVVVAEAANALDEEELSSNSTVKSSDSPVFLSKPPQTRMTRSMAKAVVNLGK